MDKTISILELTDSNYTSFMEETNAVVFIDFYSDTCGPCQTFLSYLPNLSNKFMVRSVPLTVVIGKDKMVKRAEVGLLAIDTYFKMIDKEISTGKGFLSKLFS